MAASGLLVDWTGTHNCKFLVHSLCKITKAGIGGPLVDFDGNVLGMNFYDKKIETPFLLWNEISNILAHFLEKESMISQTDSSAAEARNDSYPLSVWRVLLENGRGLQCSSKQVACAWVISVAACQLG